MDELKSVLIVNKDKKAVSTIPRVAKAKGNVPTSEEYDMLVQSHNKLVEYLRETGTIK